MSKFSIGDQVKIINYGSLFVKFKNEGLKPWDIRKSDEQGGPTPEEKIYEETDASITYDIKPNLIGQKGIITQVIEAGSMLLTNENTAYSIAGIPDKSSGYADGQLELVYRPAYII